ncbi:MAG TPA: zf-HC2 domain-containing protein [Candidatus Acidoferrales bacterium]|nr:zf-HC2 domain-containing protein [Candidatus Acidoferrales bacterium]
MECRDYREIVAGHVDGALTPAEKSEAEAHLGKCLKCRQLFNWETKATALLKQSLSPLTPRHELKQKIVNQLEEAHSKSQAWLALSRTWVPALSLLLVVAAIYSALSARIQRDLFTDTAALYQRARANLENFSATAAPSPTARILDLKPWGYRLLGRSVRQARRGENRVFVYYGEQNDLLVAQEVEGENLSAPPDSVVVKKSGKDFVSLSQGDINLIAWQDRNIICILASKLPRERLVSLAEKIATRA